MTQIRLNPPDGKRCVLLEDDGRTGCAYLLEADTIVSDVWLYNGEATAPRWGPPDELPFANRAGLIRADAERVDLGALTAQWDARGAELCLGSVLQARLERGEKPGWSRNAAADGPLARVLVATVLHELDIHDALVVALVRDELTWDEFDRQYDSFYQRYPLDGHESDAEELALLAKYEPRIALHREIWSEVLTRITGDEHLGKPTKNEAGFIGGTEANRLIRVLAEKHGLAHR